LEMPFDERFTICGGGIMTYILRQGPKLI